MDISKSRRMRILLAAFAVSTLVSLAACGGGGEGGGGGGGEQGASTIDVKVTEFAVTADATRGAAGEVTFNVQNIGGSTHEFMVVKTDLAVDQIPTAPDGSMNEEGTGIEIVDEIESIAAGQQNSLKGNLQAGKYVLVCNLVDQSGAHFKLGMRTAFTVA